MRESVFSLAEQAASPELRRIGQDGLELVGLEAPQANQAADPRVEARVAERGETLRVGDEGGEFRRDGVRPACGDGRIEFAQFGRLPGVVGPVQTVEFAQHGGGCRARCVCSSRCKRQRRASSA